MKYEPYRRSTRLFDLQLSGYDFQTRDLFTSMIPLMKATSQQPSIREISGKEAEGLLSAGT
jgi:hypothetical protein